MCDLYSSLIYVNENSLSTELCNEIIRMFESSDSKHKGLTSLGYYEPSLKDTIDIGFRTIMGKDIKWKSIYDVINKEIIYNINKYCNNYEKRLDYNINLFKNRILGVEDVLIQRYTKNVGKFAYHDDNRIDWTNHTSRVLVFMWYLNDVDIGGETEFWGTYRIKPSAGKLVIFPAEWTFPHRGIMPESNDKYIMTGWIHATAK